MKDWVKVAAGLGGAAAVGAAASVAVGTGLWARDTARAVSRLHRASCPSAAPFSGDELDGLPAPVARYFELVLAPGQRRVRGARIEHAGDFRTGGPDAPWRPFSSVQHVATSPPGFVWDATIRMLPLAGVRVRDSYLGGVGSMRGRLAAVVPVVDARGTPEMAVASLQRYLAEAPWFPTALLPASGVTWEPMDAGTARATLTDAGVTAAIELGFAPTGEIVTAHAPARFRDVKGTPVPTPWTGWLRSYRRIDGMLVPTEGEVAWLLPEGPLSYWRARIVRAEYAY